MRLREITSKTPIVNTNVQNSQSNDCILWGQPAKGKSINIMMGDRDDCLERQGKIWDDTDPDYEIIKPKPKKK